MDRSFKVNGFPASEMPADFGTSEEMPLDMLNTKSLTIMREFPIRKILRLGLEAGFSDARYKKAVFTRRHPNTIPGTAPSTSFSSDRYDVSYGRVVSAGISLRAKVEFPLTRFFGIEFALYGNINKFRTFSGFEMYLVFGRVRN
jgi:hypothetical protein